MKYKAYQVAQSDEGYQGQVVELDTNELPDSDVLIKVSHSSVNFKDALSNSGNKGVTRNFPHTPGIDAVGDVVECRNDQHQKGDSVMVIGYDLGMNTAGGYGEYIRVPAEWVLTLPAGLTPEMAAAWGTAGFTAALCIEKLQLNGVTPDKGAVLVTGATGGVGIVAVMLLHKLGYNVAAVTGKPSETERLKSLGADEVILRNDFIDESAKPMLKPLYAGAVDVAGGQMLETALKVVGYGGSVAACGLVNRPDFSASVFPFILRGVNLLGVDSVELPLSDKQNVWNKIGGEWALQNLHSQCETIGLDGLADVLKTVLNGGAVGRFIVAHE